METRVKPIKQQTQENLHEIKTENKNVLHLNLEYHDQHSEKGDAASRPAARHIKRQDAAQQARTPPVVCI